MDQIIATFMVLLVGVAALVAMLEPVSLIIKAIFSYLKLIFLGPNKSDHQSHES